MYFSVVKLGTRDGEGTDEINYLTMWDWDGGSAGSFGAHQWDSERAAILVAGPRGRLSSISLGGQIVALKVSAKILRAAQECCMEKDIKPL